VEHFDFNLYCNLVASEFAEKTNEEAMWEFIQWSYALLSHLASQKKSDASSKAFQIHARAMTFTTIGGWFESFALVVYRYSMRHGDSVSYGKQPPDWVDPALSNFINQDANISNVDFNRKISGPVRSRRNKEPYEHDLSRWLSETIDRLSYRTQSVFNAWFPEVSRDANFVTLNMEEKALLKIVGEVSTAFGVPLVELGRSGLSPLFERSAAKVQRQAEYQSVLNDLFSRSV